MGEFAGDDDWLMSALTTDHQALSGALDVPAVMPILARSVAPPTRSELSASNGRASIAAISTSPHRLAAARIPNEIPGTMPVSCSLGQPPSSFAPSVPPGSGAAVGSRVSRHPSGGSPARVRAAVDVISAGGDTWLKDALAALPPQLPRLLAPERAPLQFLKPNLPAVTPSLPLKPYLRGLDEDQLNAACAPIDKPLFLLACAGSGKTKTITARIAHVLDADPSCHPWNIACISFTRSAAGEMKSRSASVLPNDAAANGVLFSTFHGLASRLCRRFLPEWNERYTSNFSLLTDGSAVDVMEEAMRACGLVSGGGVTGPLATSLDLSMNARQAAAAVQFGGTGEGGTTSGMLRRGSNRVVTAAEIKKQVREVARFLSKEWSRLRLSGNRTQESALTKVYKEYTRILEDKDALDFVDLLHTGTQVLKSLPAAQLWVHSRCKYLFVDEFQDTSRLQAQLLIELVRYQMYLPAAFAADAGAETGGFGGVQLFNAAPAHCDTSPSPSSSPTATTATAAATASGGAPASVSPPPKRSPRLTAVGDDWQSIYSFQFANPRIFTAWLNLYKDSHCGLLRRNYRSAPPIVTFTSAVMAGPYTLPGVAKECIAMRTGTALPVIVEARDHDCEMYFLTSTIKRACEREGTGARLGHHAIMARTNRVVLSVARHLKSQGIPYRRSGSNVFQMSEVQGWVNLMRLVLDLLPIHDVPDVVAAVGSGSELSPRGVAFLRSHESHERAGVDEDAGGGSGSGGGGSSASSGLQSGVGGGAFAFLQTLKTRSTGGGSSQTAPSKRKHAGGGGSSGDGPGAKRFKVEHGDVADAPSTACQSLAGGAHTSAELSDKDVKALLKLCSDVGSLKQRARELSLVEFVKRVLSYTTRLRYPVDAQDPMLDIHCRSEGLTDGLTPGGIPLTKSTTLADALLGEAETFDDTYIEEEEVGGTGEELGVPGSASGVPGEDTGASLLRRVLHFLQHVELLIEDPGAATPPPLPAATATATSTATGTVLSGRGWGAGSSSTSSTPSASWGGGGHHASASRHKRSTSTSDAVWLGTIHQAKGLQWPTVFVVRVNEGVLPIVPRLGECVCAADLAEATPLDQCPSCLAITEEKRILYVAASRAEQQLYCTYITMVDGDEVCRSRFLGDGVLSPLLAHRHYQYQPSNGGFSTEARNVVMRSPSRLVAPRPSAALHPAPIPLLGLFDDTDAGVFDSGVSGDAVSLPLIQVAVVVAEEEAGKREPTGAS